MLDNQLVIIMRLTQIRDFVAVVDAGSIRAAARKLGISQPAVTKSVRMLETELHLRLLQRTSKGILPTAAGRAFFARARVAQAELLKATEEAAQEGGLETGSVAFGVGPAAGFTIVPEAVARFREQFPDARLRIVGGYTHTLLPMVRDETLDFAIGTRLDAKLEPVISFHPLFRHDFVIVARKGHPLCNARSLAQLADAEWISFHAWGADQGPLHRAFASAGLPVPKKLLRCESYSTTIGLLAKSDMLGIESRRMLERSFAKSYLQAIEVKEPMPSYTAGLFQRADSPLTKAALAMTKAVTATVRALR